MDRAERRWRTERIQARRRYLLPQVWGRGYMHESPEEAESYLRNNSWWGRRNDLDEIIEREIAEHHKRIGQLRDKMIYRHNRERDYYICGLVKKMKIADYDLGTWREEQNLADSRRTRERKKCGPI